MTHCVTHFYGCHCREERFKQYENALIAIMETTEGKPIGSLGYNVHMYVYGVLKEENIK